MIYIESSKAGRVTKGEAYLKRPSWKNPHFLFLTHPLNKGREVKDVSDFQRKVFSQQVSGKKNNQEGKGKEAE